MSEATLPLHLQVFAATVLLVFLGWLVYLVRYHRLSLRDSLLWLLSTFAAVAATIFPRMLTWLANVLNIAVPSNALFAVAFVYVLLNLVALTVAVSGQAARTRRLTQECALLRAEIDLLRDRLERGASSEGRRA